jgi:cell division protein FtsN
VSDQSRLVSRTPRTWGQSASRVSLPTGSYRGPSGRRITLAKAAVALLVLAAAGYLPGRLSHQPMPPLSKQPPLPLAATAAAATPSRPAPIASAAGPVTLDPAVSTTAPRVVAPVAEPRAVRAQHGHARVPAKLDRSDVRVAPVRVQRFHVQAGAFQDPDSAAGLMARLWARGYAVSIRVDGRYHDTLRYRVWVGGYLDRATAARLAENLQAAGFDPALVP